MTSILVVGSDRYVVDEAVTRGYDVVVARNTSATRTGLLRFPESVREIGLDDQTEVQSLLSGLGYAGIDLASFDGIHTNFEFSVTMMASLAGALGMPGTSVHVAVLMRDKFLQKQRLASSGFRVARARRFADQPTPADVADLGFPLVVKPISGAGAEATEKVTEPEGLARTLAAFFKRDGRGGVLIEEFIQGEEHCLDGWIVDGRVEFSSVGRYNEPCMDVVTTGSTMRMYRCTEATHPGFGTRVQDLATEALGALGYRTGLFHLEFFRTPDDTLVFSECAARRGGASIEEEVRLSRGTSLAAASLDLALGLQPVGGSAEAMCEVGTVHPKLGAGVVLGLPQADRILELPGLAYLRYFAYIGGTSSGATTSTSDRDAVFLASADSLAELDQRLDLAVARFRTETLISPNSSPGAMRDFQERVLGRVDLIDRPLPLPSHVVSQQRTNA